MNAMAVWRRPGEWAAIQTPHSNLPYKTFLLSANARGWPGMGPDWCEIANLIAACFRPSERWVKPAVFAAPLNGPAIRCCPPSWSYFLMIGGDGLNHQATQRRSRIIL